MKVEFYEFFGFLRSRYPFPFFDSINRGFCQQRVAANHLVNFAFPLGATTTPTLTVPWICALRARSGYTGTTLSTIARFPSGWS